METNSNTDCKKDKDHDWIVINLNPFTRKCKKCDKEEVWQIEMQKGKVV